MVDEYSRAYEKYYLLRYKMEDSVIKEIVKDYFNNNFDDDDIKQLKKMIKILSERKINFYAEQEAASTIVSN
ncbi:hypothetical protein [Inconstantimicrobium porci]|uniref:Uncharacterized protein n=1 Tax=Inconstantimicrobium porci TaxID=2652291 RepID=A0A7X2MYE5_9CLOT|nr:hypothetical protein [Inconstantimicrobium porci]MDD6772008.1 hypothetical protein [Inconstantimicrobium porci]MSR91345.1 hypothetical protein [Inconstantimicrobium porci]